MSKTWTLTPTHTLALGRINHLYFSNPWVSILHQQEVFLLFTPAPESSLFSFILLLKNAVKILGKNCEKL
ncbi:MAG: hypothetical protein MRERV_25c024 [Mycoplasmataceae bacterium RV_VA103A]|nr:MAG: hypothetical protein MRERV_25c024 [Mycoplasmataceae bacterium RV_VA103A]